MPAVVDFLAGLPVLVLIGALWFITIEIIPIGRLKFEGLDYNLSLSSRAGDMAFILAIATSLTVVQRMGHSLPLAAWYQVLVAIVALAIGPMWMRSNRNKRGTVQKMDAYHNVVVATIYAFLIGTTTPSGLWYGTFLERAGIVFCLLSWAGLVVFDVNRGIMDQRKYLEGWLHPGLLKK